MSYNPYQERGHGLKTKRGKNIIPLPPRKPNPLLENITNWQKANRDQFPSQAEFSIWWKGIWNQFNDDLEQIWEYLQGLCEVCLEDKASCGCEALAPSFSELVNNYEAFLTSKKSEFPTERKK